MYKICPFEYGAHQAIVIPEEIAFAKGATLEIRRDGATLIVRPVESCWTTKKTNIDSHSKVATEPPILINETASFTLTSVSPKKAH